MVKLDQRLPMTQAQLQQCFDLLTHINGAITDRATNVNAALDTRSDLEKALANKSVSGKAAQRVLADLNCDTEGSVDLKIQVGGGALVFASQLRAHLSAIATAVAETSLQ